MPPHSAVMRLMRFMTHLNIGAMLGMFAWLIWSGWQVTTGQIVNARPELPVPSLSEPMRLVPINAAKHIEGHCLPPAAMAHQVSEPHVSGADL